MTADASSRRAPAESVASAPNSVPMLHGLAKFPTGTCSSRQRPFNGVELLGTDVFCADVLPRLLGDDQQPFVCCNSMPRFAQKPADGDVPRWSFDMPEADSGGAPYCPGKLLSTLATKPWDRKTVPALVATEGTLAEALAGVLALAEKAADSVKTSDSGAGTPATCSPGWSAEKDATSPDDDGFACLGDSDDQDDITPSYHGQGDSCVGVLDFDDAHGVQWANCGHPFDAQAHQLGTCKPCAFVFTEGGCQSGEECKFCHLCGPGEKKRRKKERQAARRNGQFDVLGGVPPIPFGGVW